MDDFETTDERLTAQDVYRRVYGFYTTGQYEAFCAGWLASRSYFRAQSEREIREAVERLSRSQQSP